MNAQQKRAGKTRYHVDVVSCGCPDENCGAFHVLRTERPFPQSPKPRVRWLRTNGPEKLATIDGNTTAAGKAGQPSAHRGRRLQRKWSCFCFGCNDGEHWFCWGHDVHACVAGNEAIMASRTDLDANHRFPSFRLRRVERRSFNAVCEMLAN